MTTIDISDDWQDKVTSSKNPVIVDFWAPWCPWCMKLMPAFEEVSNQYEGKLVFAKRQNVFISNSCSLKQIKT